MKNTKWIWRTLAIVLSLVILAGVGAAGFRMGFMQGVNTTQKAGETSPFFGHMQGFGGEFNQKLEGSGDPNMQGFDHLQERGFGRGFNRGMRHGGFSHLFGLFHLVVLGLLLWAGYALYKKSGWQFVKVNASEEVEPIETKPDEVKSEKKKKK